MDRRAVVRLLITDLDNTLYDWEAFFVPAFTAMIDEVQRLSGLARSDLEQSFRRIYQEHRTSEYAFVLQEADVLRALHPTMSPDELSETYDSAIHAFRSERKRRLRLYPQVRETLESLKRAGILLVAQSDSPMGYVSRRLRQLDVDRLFDAICAPQDHGVPVEMSASRIRRAPDEQVMARTRLLEFDSALRKPDPLVLDPVFRMFNVPRNRAAYVGDNLSRDVLVARRSGIVDIWARYGAHHDPRMRDQLLRITYWSDADVASEDRLRAEASLAPPTYVIDSFSDVLPIVGVGPER